jgi:hypothetical protein
VQSDKVKDNLIRLSSQVADECRIQDFHPLGGHDRGLDSVVNCSSTVRDNETGRFDATVKD